MCVCGGVRHTVKSPCLHKSSSHFALARRQESPFPPTCSLLARRQRQRRLRATNATTVDLNNETQPLSMWLYKYYIDNLTFTGFPICEKCRLICWRQKQTSWEGVGRFPPNMWSVFLPSDGHSLYSAGPMHLFTVKRQRATLYLPGTRSVWSVGFGKQLSGCIFYRVLLRYDSMCLFNVSGHGRPHSCYNKRGSPLYLCVRLCLLL